MRIIADKPGTLYLGKQGENLARELVFREPACWAEESGGQGTVQLLVRPSGGGAAYPVILESEEGVFVWHVTAADTARAGYGSCELRWSVEDRVVKSKTYTTFVAKSMFGGCGRNCHCSCGPTDDPTDRWSAYLEQVAQAGADALEAALRSENAVLHSPTILTGTWWVWDHTQDKYVDTGVPVSGGEGPYYRFGHGLKQEDSVISVDAADDFNGDKTRPITAAAVETTLGNIEVLLETI